MQIVSTDVLDTVRITDDSAEGGTRLINACDLTDADQVVEEIAKGGRRTRRAAEPSVPEVSSAPEAAPQESAAAATPPEA